MPMYHSNFYTTSLQHSMLRHRFVSNSFLEGTQRTRRYVIYCVWVHVTPVARVMATESRRNWLYFVGEKLEQPFAIFVVLRGILYMTVCCVLQTDKQLRCTFGPSHVFSKEKASKRAVSNVWCKVIVCMMAEVFVDMQKVFSSLFSLSCSFVWGVLLFSLTTSDLSMSDRKYVCRCSAFPQCRSHSTCVTPGRHGLTSRTGNLVCCTAT